MGYRKRWLLFLTRSHASACWLLAATLFLIPFFGFTRASYASGCKGLDLIRKEIVILNHARIKVMKNTNGDSLADKQFISYLKKRIGELCANASLSCGTWATKGLPCPSVLPLLPNLATSRQPYHKKKIKDADAALIKSLGEFDEILLEEQRKAEQVRIQTKEEAVMSQAIKGYEEDPSTGECNRKGKKGNEKQGVTTQDGIKKGHDKKEASGVTVAGKASKEQTAQGISSLAKDDDIVARQLREAAEKEKDPELRKRLWEEYRKYKEGR